MQFKTIKTDHLSAHQIYLVSEKTNTDSFSSDVQSQIEQFLKGEDNFFCSTQFDSKTIFVKIDDDKNKMRKAGASARKALGSKVETVSIPTDTSSLFFFLEGFLLSDYQFLKYFKEETKEKKQSKLQSIEVLESFGAEERNELLNIQKAVFWSRDMVNEPLSYLTAEKFAEEMSAFSKDTSMEVSVLEKTQIETLRMGGLLAVNKGSIDPPTFTIMEYKGEGHSQEKPIVLVGKGVVYDTGGLSLKPTANSMDIMKSDMGGAAAVAGAMYLIALQKLPVHVIALVPATDNRPSLNAYAPGDVVTMYNGLTVEVLNTDAEGRMILADALSYSKKYNPELVIDAATLTGAAVRAIGDHASVVMGNASRKEMNNLIEAGNQSHDRVVEFPFWEEYGEEMKSSIADLKNLGGASAGMITAGKFLENFVESPYIHIDLAGPAWISADKDYRTKGGTGAGVRLLYQFFKNRK